MATLSHAVMRRFPGIFYRHALSNHQYIQRANLAEKMYEKYEKVVSLEEPAPQLSEEEVEKIRNCSDLRYDDYYFMNKGIHRQIDPQDMPVHMKTLRYQRKEIGRYGFQGSYDPAIGFTTKEEMKDLIEYEKVAFDKPILEIRKLELEKIAQRKKQRREREEHITKALATMPDWKQKIREKMIEKEGTMEQAKANRARLLEEVRRFFGYTIDLRDEKFQIMLEHKERELQKKKKSEQKKRKEEEFLKKLAALESGGGASDSKKGTPRTENSADKKTEEAATNTKTRD